MPHLLLTARCYHSRTPPQPTEWLKSMRATTILLIPFASMAIAASSLQQAERSVFQLPALHAQTLRLQQQTLLLSRAGRLEEAEQAAAAVVQLNPENPAGHYNLGCIRAVAKKSDAAFTSLTEAVRLGFRNVDHIRGDKDLAGIRDDPRFDELLKAASEPFEPTSVQEFAAADINDGIALVTASNTRWVAARNTLIASFNEPDKKLADRPVTIGGDPAFEAVREWYAEGTAAGNVGDLYDNRDRDHSNMHYKRFPQITRIEYGEEPKKLNADWGVQINLASIDRRLATHRLPRLVRPTGAVIRGYSWSTRTRRGWSTTSITAIRCTSIPSTLTMTRSTAMSTRRTFHSASFHRVHHAVTRSSCLLWH